MPSPSVLGCELGYSRKLDSAMRSRILDTQRRDGHVEKVALKERRQIPATLNGSKISGQSPRLPPLWTSGKRWLQGTMPLMLACYFLPHTFRADHREDAS